MDDVLLEVRLWTVLAILTLCVVVAWRETIGRESVSGVHERPWLFGALLAGAAALALVSLWRGSREAAWGGWLVGWGALIAASLLASCSPPTTGIFASSWWGDAERGMGRRRWVVLAAQAVVLAACGWGAAADRPELYLGGLGIYAVTLRVAERAGRRARLTGDVTPPAVAVS